MFRYERIRQRIRWRKGESCLTCNLDIVESFASGLSPMDIGLVEPRD